MFLSGNTRLAPEVPNTLAEPLNNVLKGPPQTKM